MIEPKLKSRYLELYPMHKCPDCGMEHTRMPELSVGIVKDGKPVKSPLAPFELVGTADITMEPITNGDFKSSPAHILALFWGPPGASEPATTQLIYLN
ncbi:hypothetical protein LCGC14_2695180 [marine sediment metagenome]|uniref:Uncharacterized protein n=1 Tax=marine sediment metagenome TaxID=412755 RepID=A0A0F9BRU7_9ZZZZ